MNTKDRKYGFYLEDMLISMERIEEYINVLEFIQFKQNHMIVDAVIRNFEMIFLFLFFSFHSLRLLLQYVGNLLCLFVQISNSGSK